MCLTLIAADLGVAQHVDDDRVPQELDLRVLIARSCMIFEARSSVPAVDDGHLGGELVRNVASSRAVSPPPTTAICCSRKKKPSQVAQADTP